MASAVKVTRTTSESSMKVVLSEGPVAKDYRSKIKTPLPFLNHMIEQTVWRSGFNIEADVSLSDFQLAHLVTEDLGQAVGKAFARFLENTDGAPGFSDAFGIIDEAAAHTLISFESRAYFSFNSSVTVPENVEGMASEELLVFLDAFAQGACCTIQIDLMRGENTHHIWEAVFRSFGTALKNAFSPDPSRLGMTSGVAGKVVFETEEI
jgi:imidazoleglycerol-phosphate dehydratase